MQKRRLLQKNESQNSKKSLCLQEAFPEAVITLNKEILEKRLANGLSHRSNPGSTGPASGLKSARESYKTFMTAEQAIRDSKEVPLDNNRPEKEGSVKKTKKMSLPPQCASKRVPPRVPQTTRNVAKINNFISDGLDEKASKPIKFNFNLQVSAMNEAKKEDSEAKETQKKRVVKSR